MKNFVVLCALLMAMLVIAPKAEAQHCFVNSGQSFVVQQQPVFVSRPYVQQSFVQQPVFVRQPVFVNQQRFRQPVFVRSRFRQPVFIRRQPVFIGQRAFVGRGSGLRNLSLLGAFGNDAQRFSAVATGLGF